MKPKIIKNFLSKNDFKKIENLMVKGGTEFPWYYQTSISGERKEYKRAHYFIHMFYCWNKVNSTHFDLLKPILNKLNVKKLHRVKANFYHHTDKIIIHPTHIDHIEDVKQSHKGCIFSLNTCDGYTIIENKTKKGFRVKSVRNQSLIFDPSIPHSSTSCTNAKSRINININYE